MATIFYHIPRTSGSTVWHSMAAKAAADGIPVLDLYHESITRYQTPFRAGDALAYLSEQIDLSADKIIFHHHTRQNIGNLLPYGEHRYITIVRDPVERFISEVFHLREFCINSTINARHALIDSFGYSALFRSVIQDEHLPSDDLLRIAGTEPSLRNAYVKSFWQLFFGDPQQGAFVESPEVNSIVNKVAETVRECFALVARYPDVGRACVDCAGVAGISEPHKIIVHNIANGVRDKPTVRVSTLKWLREMNAVDYRFLNAITKDRAA